MTYVITAPCIDVKDGACTLACPVDCIYEGGRMFYIHPEECINCGLCLSICPVDAIHTDVDIPAEEAHFTEVNAAFFGPEVTGLGVPGGWEAAISTEADHPLVAAWPARPEAETG